MIFAHSVAGAPTTQWEPLSDHLAAVANTAQGFAASFGAGLPAHAMGLLHDIGKCSQAYQTYIGRPQVADNQRHGPDHSTAGAREAIALYGEMLGKLMAFGIAGHHAGLSDGVDLARRREKEIEPYPGWRDHAVDLPDLATMRDGLPRLQPNPFAPGFAQAFLTRMLFSCLVDADWLETERFAAQSRGERAPARGGCLTVAHRDAVRAFMAAHRRDDTALNRLRSAILDHAVDKAALPPGLFTLTVPTGGGKTLTSLSFATEHAIAHGLRRIVYVIPFTSIIEQTADIFRTLLGDAVLEHHASFDPEARAPASDGDMEAEGADGAAKLRRDAENWDAPVVVTTAVQFFESLFAARRGKARKLHNLARSVIVIDEAQSMPVHLLRPCLAALDELARNYGATIVLCTATQPALRKEDGALPRTKADGIEGLDIGDARELAPDPALLYEKLKRVELVWRRDPTDDDTIAARFAEQPQMLCIVNSRAHARALFEAIESQGGAIHLTTLLCAQHRRAVLARVRDDLVHRRPVRLVATSLIEAGVDVDFPEVWRAAAGLASIAQAAGRCNREGRSDGFGRTVVFEPATHKPPPAIEAFYGPAREVLRREGLDPLGLEANTLYYQALYFRQGYDALDRPTGKDAVAILPSISDRARSLDFPFRSVADSFRLIDEVMDPVIIPWDAAASDAIADLSDPYRPFPPAGILRRLQSYVVPVPAKVRAAMLAAGAVEMIRPKKYGDRFVLLQNMDLYDPLRGLRLDQPTFREGESNIFA